MIPLLRIYISGSPAPGPATDTSDTNPSDAENPKSGTTGTSPASTAKTPLCRCYEAFIKKETPVLGIDRAQWRWFFVLTCMVVGTTTCASSALNYVNFPVKVIARCSKLVPSMIIGVLLLGKHYVWKLYVAALMVSVGVAIFILASAAVSPTFSAVGLTHTHAHTHTHTHTHAHTQVSSSWPFR